MGAEATKKCTSCRANKEEEQNEEEHVFAPPPIEESNINANKEINNTKDTLDRGPTLNELIDI